MARDDVDTPAAPVLEIVDRTLFIGVPLVVLSALLIAFPTGPMVGLRVLGLTLAGAWVLSLLGTLGRAPWRRSLYPVLMLVIGLIGLWTQGPNAGVGATVGLAALLAGALSSRAVLWLIVGAGVAAFVVAASLSVAGSGSAVQVLAFEGLRIWIRIALAVSVVLWIAIRVLGALIASLELSYARALEAYQRETETRVELDSSRQQLDEVEHIELLGRLAGGVAHDINNALTAILSASDLLGDKITAPVQRRDLGELEAASHQAAELVRDLLWIGRKFPPSTSIADVDATVRACLQRLERMGRRVELDVAIPALRVALAPERLEQVLFRLIVRAHGAGSRQLALTARRVDALVELELRGTEELVRATTSSRFRPKEVSARLGMSAAKDVVEQAGGSLTVTSDARQLSIQVRLPAAELEPRPARPATDRPRTALIVDDEPLILGRLAKLVGRRGYTVMVASSLAEAWPLLATAPDLLVTDLQLGDGDGADLALASFAAAPDRPIVVCSGFGADDELRDRLADAHIQFLAKPFTMVELEVAIPHVAREAE